MAFDADVFCRIDLNKLKTYQQVYTYLMAIITNMAFINVIVVVVRLYWFKRKMKAVGRYHKSSKSSQDL